MCLFYQGLPSMTPRWSQPRLTTLMGRWLVVTGLRRHGAGAEVASGSCGRQATTRWRELGSRRRTGDWCVETNPSLWAVVGFEPVGGSRRVRERARERGRCGPLAAVSCGGARRLSLLFSPLFFALSLARYRFALHNPTGLCNTNPHMPLFRLDLDCHCETTLKPRMATAGAPAFLEDDPLAGALAVGAGSIRGDPCYAPWARASAREEFAR